MAADYYAIHKIEDTKKSGIDLKIAWVKACQDNKMAIEQLPPEAQLNVMTDADVNKIWASAPIHLEIPTTPLVLLSNKVFITINGTVVTSNLQQWLPEREEDSPCRTWSGSIGKILMQHMSIRNFKLKYISQNSCTTG
eukprot:11831930-Ditylum_brightwellii.AAC.2